jgi:hypothetical protein
MAMFTLPQMISRLTKGFVKFTGRKPDGLEKIKIKQEALERIKQQDKVVDMEGNVIDTSKGIMGGKEMKAMGGRIGYKDGPDVPGRRKFMKIMGGLATIPFVGKFFKGAKTAAPAVEKAAEVAGQAPSYFFDLVAKIKMLGKSGISTGPRQNTMNYKNYELMEDVSTGDLRITKRDPKYAQEEVLEYRKGQRTEDGVIPDEYEEVTIRADMDGKMKDFDVGIEEDTIKEIVEETTKEAPSIKKADGGIAMMLGE